MERVDAVPIDTRLALAAAMARMDMPSKIFGMALETAAHGYDCVLQRLETADP
jgi:hypothetical protein